MNCPECGKFMVADDLDVDECGYTNWVCPDNNCKGCILDDDSRYDIIWNKIDKNRQNI